MSQQTRSQVKPLPKTSFTPVQSNLLQRKCGCGRSASLTGQCNECQRKKLAPERGSTDLVNASEAPPVVHEVLRSSFPKIQPKLKIGTPNDKYEQEADRIADQVMRMPEPEVQRQVEEEEEEETLQAKPSSRQITPLVQRQTETEEEDEEEEMLQTKPSFSHTPKTAPDIEAGIQSLRQSDGQLLPPSTRAFMESRFKRDFSNVHIHIGNKASHLTQKLNARAFTIGNDIVFGSGGFNFQTTAGRKLLAHELTHTIQQTSQAPGIVQRIGGEAQSKAPCPPRRCLKNHPIKIADILVESKDNVRSVYIRAFRQRGLENAEEIVNKLYQIGMLEVLRNFKPGKCFTACLTKEALEAVGVSLGSTTQEDASKSIESEEKEPKALSEVPVPAAAAAASKEGANKLRPGEVAILTVPNNNEKSIRLIKAGVVEVSGKKQTEVEELVKQVAGAALRESFSRVSRIKLAAFESSLELQIPQLHPDINKIHVFADIGKIENFFIEQGFVSEEELGEEEGILATLEIPVESAQSAEKIKTILGIGELFFGGGTILGAKKALKLSKKQLVRRGEKQRRRTARKTSRAARKTSRAKRKTFGEQRRDPKGRFLKRRKGEIKPGGIIERKVAEKLQKSYSKVGEQIKIFPLDKNGKKIYPPIIADFVASNDSKKLEIFIFEVKGFRPKGRIRQKQAIENLRKYGGKVFSDKSDAFPRDTLIPPVDVKTITPDNIDDL